MSTQDNEKDLYQQPEQPQQQNSYQPQQPYGNTPQQPYGNQYPQQPLYGYQPYPQQPVYVVSQPAPPVKKTASPEVKGAAFSAGSSVFMLILCIISTLNLVSGLIGKILSLDIGGLLIFVLDILIVIGAWITFSNAKRKNPSTKGISLIRVPYIIQFVFAVFEFVGNLSIWFITMNIVSLMIGIITFIFQCICFSSVNKTLLLAQDINADNSVDGRKAGSFAAIIMIISSALTLIESIVGYVSASVIMNALMNIIGQAGLPEEVMSILAGLLGGGNAMVLIIAIITFIVGISGAIVMLQFGKKVKEANER